MGISTLERILISFPELENGVVEFVPKCEIANTRIQKDVDLAKFRRSCGECTDEELVRAVAEIDPTVEVPDQAKAWIWALIQRLLNTERYALAGILLWGDALFNPGPRAVQQLLRFVRSTQNMIVLGAAAMGKRTR